MVLLPLNTAARLPTGVILFFGGIVPSPPLLFNLVLDRCIKAERTIKPVATSSFSGVLVGVPRGD
jgi:hypothetical protein